MSLPRLSRLRSRLAGWGAAGLVLAVALILGSAAALDRHVLGHDEWARESARNGGVLVLTPEGAGVNQPGGSGRAEGGPARAQERRRQQRETGGTVAPEPRPRAPRRDDEPLPEDEGFVRVSAPAESDPPSVVRTLPGDSDSDGLTDRLEARLGTDPRREDSDGDALPDGWEEQYGLDPMNGTDAEDDLDGDGLHNRTEFRVSSNPRVLDSNRDGTPDGADDADGDDLPNAVEQALPGAEPDNPDTNGDGQGDGADDEDGDGVVNVDEVAAGTDPGVPDAPVVEAPPVDAAPTEPVEPAEPPAPAEEPAPAPAAEPAPAPAPAEEPAPAAELAPAPEAAPADPAAPPAP